MKNRFRTLAFLLAMPALLLTTSCKDEHDDEVKPELELSVEVVSTTHDTVRATFTPSISEDKYYAGIHPAEAVGEDNGVALAQEIVAAEGFDANLYNGTRTLTFDGLTPESDYYVVAFGYDVVASQMTTEVILSDKITTAETPKPVYDVTIELALGATTWRDAEVDFTISDEEAEFILGVVEKSIWDGYESPEGAIDACIAKWQYNAEHGVQNYPDLDTWQKWMQLEQHSGSGLRNLREYRNMYWSSEYVCYAFGMNDEGERTTELAFVEFTTQTPTASENVITIAVDETTKSSVNFTITATNDDPYFVSIQTIDYLARFGEDKDESFDDMIFDLTFSKTDDQLAQSVFSGSRSFTQEDINTTVNGFKEYRVVVWGFEDGPTTEIFFSENFKPGSTHEPTPDLTLSVSEISWCDAAVAISPKTTNGKYIVGGFSKADWDATYASDPETTVYNKHKAKWERMADMYYSTWQEEMRFEAKTGEFNGNATNIIGKSRLVWDTDYIVYAFGVDATTGEMNTELITAEFTTSAPASSDNSIAVTINSTTLSSVDFTVTATNDDPYYVTIEEEAVVNGYATDDELIKGLIPDNDTQLEQRTFNGTQNLTQDNLGRTVNGFKNYYVLVWGFENGATTSLVKSELFKPGTTHQTETTE